MISSTIAFAGSYTLREPLYAVPITMSHHGKYVAKLYCIAMSVDQTFLASAVIWIRDWTCLEPETSMVDIVPLGRVPDQFSNEDERAIGQLVSTVVLTGAHSSQREKYSLLDIRQVRDHRSELRGHHVKAETLDRVIVCRAEGE